MGPSKVLETRSEAEAIWLEAKEDCGFRVLGSSLPAEVYPTSAISPDGDWLSKVCFKLNEARDAVIAVVVKRRGEYFPFFLGVKSQDGQPKAVLDKVWASPVSRFGAVDVFNDGFCALAVKSQTGDIFSTQPGAVNIHYIADGSLLCRYLMGLADEANLFSAEKTSPEAVLERRLILTLQAGRQDAEDIKPQEPRAEERKSLKAKLAEQEEQIGLLNIELAKKDLQDEGQKAEISALNKTLEEREAAMAELQAKLAKPGEQISQSEVFQDKLLRICKEKEAIIAEMPARIEELTGGLARRDTQIALQEELVTKLAQEKAELGQEIMKQVDQAGEIARNWERAARALKEVIAGSLLFKHFPNVRKALAKFPPETEI